MVPTPEEAHMIFAHRHRYEAIAVENKAIGPFLPISTTILWRCPCRDVHSTNIAGDWTLAQVRGEEPTGRQRVEAELAVSEAREAARA
jgi:hypothetical protein